jgi:hypothetical protein
MTSRRARAVRRASVVASPDIDSSATIVALLVVDEDRRRGGAPLAAQRWADEAEIARTMLACTALTCAQSPSP